MRQAADTYLHLPRRRFVSALDMHAAGIGSIGAAVLLVGWGLNFEPLTHILPGFPTMKPTTAAGFMLLSISCLLSLRTSRRSKLIALGLVAAVIIGGLTLFTWPEQPEWEGTWAQFPSPGTVICLMLAAGAMGVIIAAPRFGLAAAALALAGATPALYRLLAMVMFGGAPPEKGSPLDTMSLPTAALIVWFMTVCVLMHPRLGFGAALREASLRGRLLRRVLPTVVLAPVVAAAISLLLTLAFGSSGELLFAMTATLSVMLGAGLIWWVSGIAEDWQEKSNAHASRLSRANEALEQYASSAAHDLKAPARHVMLYGELLEDALAKGDLDAARRHARSIRESAAEMPVMIDGLLDYSRSGFTRLNPGHHRLSELVHAATRSLDQDLKSSAAQINVLREADLWCDFALLMTVFQNLIANSIKSRRKDRQLVIRIDADIGGERTLISVEDNGVGFDPDFATVAFNPLARGVRTAGEGAGIGLATCRTIVQGHGGEIRVDPTFKGGARIEFTLPATAPLDDSRADPPG